jgi:hypothetical protein
MISVVKAELHADTVPVKTGRVRVTNMALAKGRPYSQSAKGKARREPRANSAVAR